MSTAILHIEKKKMNVPQLRFKEFSADWKEDRFDSFCTLQRGFDLTNSNRKEGEVPVYSSSGISYYHNEVKVKAPGIVTGRKGKIGSVFYIEEDFWPHDTSLWVKDFHRNDERFVYWFLLQFKLERFEASSSVPTLNRNNVHNIKVSLPTLPEQQKIASFLSSVDEKIQQLSRKKELLERYKKGTMQQLFSGKLRFKDENGEDYADWEKMKLHNLCDYKNGGSFENYVCDDGEYNLISLNSIDINGKIKNQHKKVSITDNSLKKGDLIMVLSDVAYGNFLGLTDIVPGDNFVLNQRMGALKPVKDFNSFYLKTFINFNQNYFKLKGQGSSQQNLSKGDIINFIVNLPCVEEQQKIADFLSNIDIKIDSTSQQINQTQSFKKGLLQQMFV